MQLCDRSAFDVRGWPDARLSRTSAARFIIVKDHLVMGDFMRGMPCVTTYEQLQRIKDKQAITAYGKIDSISLVEGSSELILEEGAEVPAKCGLRIRISSEPNGKLTILIFDVKNYMSKLKPLREAYQK